jgi:hypothetical protein
LVRYRKEADLERLWRLFAEFFDADITLPRFFGAMLYRMEA